MTDEDKPRAVKMGRTQTRSFVHEQNDASSDLFNAGMDASSTMPAISSVPSSSSIARTRPSDNSPQRQPPQMSEFGDFLLWLRSLPSARCAELRKRFQSLLYQVPPPTESLVQTFAEAWQAACDLAYTISFKKRLSPPFQHKMLRVCLENTMFNVASVERNFLPDQKVEWSNGKGVFLDGVKGSGKTTVCLGCAMAIAILCEHVLPIYHDFSESGFIRPSVLMEKEASRFGIPVLAPPPPEPGFEHLLPSPLQLALLRLQYGKHIVAFFGDEIQCLYHLTPFNLPTNNTLESTDIPEARKAMWELRFVGKSSGHFGFITGSSTLARYLVFREKQELFKANEGYPSLDGLYTRGFHLNALRTKEEIDFFLESRQFNRLTAEEVFELTGGVGGAMVKLTNANDDTTIRAEAAKKKNEFIQQSTHEDPLLFAVVLRFLEINGLFDPDEKLDVWNMKGVRLSTVEHLAEERYIDNPQIRYSTWCDRGFMHLVDSYYLVLFSPEHVKVLLEILRQGDYKTLLAFESTFRLWMCGPGQLPERYLLSRLSKAEGLPFYNTICRGDVLKFTPHGLVRVGPDGQETALPFENALNETFITTLDKKHGRQDEDCVLMTETNPGQVYVHCGQINLGALGGEISLGGPLAARDISNPTVLISVCAKAQHGIKNLLANLRDMFPEKRFSCVSFSLITSKTLCPPAQAWWEKGELNTLIFPEVDQVNQQSLCLLQGPACLSLIEDAWQLLLLGPRKASVVVVPESATLPEQSLHDYLFVKRKWIEYIQNYQSLYITPYLPSP